MRCVAFVAPAGKQTATSPQVALLCHSRRRFKTQLAPWATAAVSVTQQAVEQLAVRKATCAEQPHTRIKSAVGRALPGCTSRSSTSRRRAVACHAASSAAAAARLALHAFQAAAAGAASAVAGANFSALGAAIAGGLLIRSVTRALPGAHHRRGVAAAGRGRDGGMMQPAREFTVVTFNIRGVMDRWQERAPLLKRCLQELDADVICFQEVMTGALICSVAILAVAQRVEDVAYVQVGFDRH